MNEFVAALGRAEKIIGHFYAVLWQIEMIIRVPDPRFTDQQRLKQILTIIEKARETRP